jgi:hypothetical protein
MLPDIRGWAIMIVVMRVLFENVSEMFIIEHKELYQTGIRLLKLRN